MAGSVPGVLEIFFSRIESSDAEERAHAANCILDIAKHEPALLDRDDLRKASSRLESIKDRSSLDLVRRSLAKLKRKQRRSRFKYGL
jgi:hypothetical protein